MTKEQIQTFTLRVSQENHTGLVLVLVDMEDIYIEDALKAYGEKDTALYLRNMELAKRVHQELMNCINQTDVQGKKVLAVFRCLYKCYVDATVKREPKDVEEAKQILRKLRATFQAVHEQDTEGPVMRNTHQVYSGLTYGKGVLNESVMGVDYSTRGFSV